MSGRTRDLRRKTAQESLSMRQNIYSRHRLISPLWACIFGLIKRLGLLSGGFFVVLFNKMSGKKLGLLSGWAYYPEGLLTDVYCISAIFPFFSLTFQPGENRGEEKVWHEEEVRGIRVTFWKSAKTEYECALDSVRSRSSSSSSTSFRFFDVEQLETRTCRSRRKSRSLNETECSSSRRG